MPDAIATEYVEVRPDTKGFGRELQRNVSKESGKAGKRGGALLSKGMLLGAAGVAGAVGGAALAVKSFVSAAMEAEVQTTRAKTAFKAMGISTKDMDKAMSRAGKTATQLGFDDEVAEESLATLTRTTGKLSTGQRGLAAAMDVARARGITLEAATKVVSRAQFGNARVLQQMGIKLEKVTTNTDAMKKRVKELKDEQKGATDEEKKALQGQIDRIKSHEKEAKELDKQATARKALGLIEKNLGKQAEEFSKTSAGALATLGERWNNFQEDVGAAVLPIVADLGTKAADALSTFADVSVTAIGKAKQALGPYVDELKTRFGPDIAAAAATAKQTLAQTFDGAGPAISNALANIGPIVMEALAGMAPGARAVFADVQLAIQENLASARSIVSSFATAVSNIWGRWGDEIKATAKVVFTLVVTIIRTGLNVARNLFAAFAAVLRGDWDEAWNRLKAAAKAALDGVVQVLRTLGPALLGVLRAIGAQLLQSGRELGGKVKDGLVAGLKALPGALAAGIAALPGIAKAFASTMLANGKILAGKIKDGLVAGLKALPGALAGGVVAAFGVFSSIASAAYNIALTVGGAIIDGLVSGVQSAAGRLASAAVSAVTSALSAAKAAIGFGSPARKFIPIGAAMMQGISVGIKQWAPAMQDELKTAVRDAVQAARQNVQGLSGSLADIVTSALDKRNKKNIPDAVPIGETPAERAVREAQAQIDALAQRKKIDDLRKQSTDTKLTQQERNDASLQLTVALNEQQAALDGERRQKELEAAQKSVEEARQAEEQKVSDQKAALERQIADLTDAFNRKKKEQDGSIITTKEYMERLQKLLHDAVPDFGEIGSALGSAVANEFQDNLAAIAAQLAALRGAAPGIQTGEVTDPEQVAQAAAKLRPARRRRAAEEFDVFQAQNALDKAIEKATGDKSAGGAKITAEERAEINRRQEELNVQKHQLAVQQAIVTNLERIVQGGGSIQLTTTLAR